MIKDDEDYDDACNTAFEAVIPYGVTNPFAAQAAVDALLAKGLFK